MSSKAEIELAKKEFADWVKAYGVYETMADDELVVTDEIKPFVWTEFMNDQESFVAPGYTQASSDLRMPVVGYYLSKAPYPQEDLIVMVSMVLDCSDCEGMGEDDDGDECETCSGEMGTYIEFGLDAD